MLLEFRNSMYSVIPWNSANPISWCRLLGCRPKEKAVNQMIVQEWLPTLPSIAAFTSQGTDLAPFIKGCREWDTSMWIYVCLRGLQPQSLWSSYWFARERLRNEFKGARCWAYLLGLWLWSSAISVLISVTPDMYPTGDLHVKAMFLRGDVSLSLLRRSYVLPCHELENIIRILNFSKQKKQISQNQITSNPNFTSSHLKILKHNYYKIQNSNNFNFKDTTSSTSST